MIKAGRNEIRMRLARHYLEVCDRAARILRDGKHPVEIVKDVPHVLEAQSAVTELADTLPEAERLCWQFPFALGVAGTSLIGLARTIQWNEKGLAIARQAVPGEAGTRLPCPARSSALSCAPQTDSSATDADRPS
jgi:hypothetical protein